MQDYNDISISTHLVFSKGQEFILGKEFIGREEFSICGLHSLEQYGGSRWQAFRAAVAHAQFVGNDDVIVVCFEGHRFSREYRRTELMKDVIAAAALGTQVLFGGCSDFNNLVPLNERMLWVDHVKDFNFCVVFHPVFRTILAIRPDGRMSLEEILSENIANKLLLSPSVTQSESEDRVSVYIQVAKKYHVI